jgi:glycosyltransferase involved in cell wall biosynthesis
MKILHTVEFYRPSVGGAQEVVRQVSERLAQRGHDVTVATTRLADRTQTEIAGVRIEEFDIAGNAVRGMTGETSRYQELLRTGDFDVVMNYAAQQWATDLALPILDEIPYAKVLAPCGFSGLHDPSYADYFASLPGSLRRYDHLIFHSGSYQDTNFAAERGISNYTVVPNGAGKDEFGPATADFRATHGVPKGLPLLLTVGGHTGTKGHALTIEAFRRARIGRAFLVIVANTLGSPGCLPDCERRARRASRWSLGRKQVLLLDPPRSDVLAAYQAADLFVFASNIECSPLVLFEAMASHTPFVTVAAGNAEEIAQWSGGGVVVPTTRLADGRVTTETSTMSREIEHVMRDPEGRERMATDGHRAWSEKFTWEEIIGSYEAVYAAAVKAHHR